MINMNIELWLRKKKGEMSCSRLYVRTENSSDVRQYETS